MKLKDKLKDLRQILAVDVAVIPSATRHTKWSRRRASAHRKEVNAHVARGYRLVAGFDVLRLKGAAAQPVAWAANVKGVQ